MSIKSQSKLALPKRGGSKLGLGRRPSDAETKQSSRAVSTRAASGANRSPSTRTSSAKSRGKSMNSEKGGAFKPEQHSFAYQGASRKAAKRRSYGVRRLEVSAGQPHISPQFSPELLRQQGRDVNPASTLKRSDSSKKSSLKLIALGGLCEIGKNMTLYECGNDLIIVDVGISFPEEHHPGVDSVIPDMRYVFENRHRLKGIFITHGHEDHIGSLSWLLSQVSAPVYSLPLTCELMKLKLEDKGLGKQTNLLKRIRLGERIRAGCFEVEFIHVNHSIADSAALAIRTPAGLVVHSGDFKIDYTPIHGEPMDLQRFAELGAEGVLLFVCESTNVERKGFTPSERIVGEAFAAEFQKADGRIIVATFSSNVHRIQQIIEAAERHGRKVAISGRSMTNIFKAAQNLSYLKIKPDTLIDLRDIDQYPDEKLVIITTGSQGEPMSALTRMAYSEHRNIEIGKGDTVIISATPIPGNEKPIYRVINELYKRKAKVVYSALSDIHVSGHAYREELKILHRLVKPRYFVPAHGEYRHLYMHAQLANQLGQSMDSIYLLNNGDIFECRADEAKIAGYTTAASVLIDGSPEGTVDTQVLEQRLRLADDGIVMLALAYRAQDATLCGDLRIQSKGFVYPHEFQVLADEMRKRVTAYFDRLKKSGQKLSEGMIHNQLHETLQNYLYQQTKRKPVLVLSLLNLD